MVGDPPVQREGSLAPQEDLLVFLSFEFELGMLFYQGGWNLWACLGTKVLLLPLFYPMRVVLDLRAHLNVFAKPFSALLLVPTEVSQVSAEVS